MLYIINGWSKDAIEDIYETGETSGITLFDGKDQFISKTIKEVITKFIKFCDADEDSIAINPVEDDSSRIDIQVLEDENGVKASEQEIEKWKVGEFRLWTCTYTARVRSMQDVSIPENWNK